MELVERTANRTESGGRTRYYGNFKCPFCGNIVERLKHNGRNQKSCGCNTNTGQPTIEKSRLKKEEAIKKFTRNIKIDFKDDKKVHWFDENILFVLNKT